MLLIQLLTNVLETDAIPLFHRTSWIGAGRKSSPECEDGHVPVIVRLFLLYSYSINIVRTWLWLITRPALDQL